MKRAGIIYTEAVELVSGLTKAQVDSYAAKAGDVLGLKPGGDVFALTKKLGGRVQIEDIFDSSVAEDTIYVHAPEDFDIILSSISSPRRDRFTIAHELGHYLLHSEQGKHPMVAARSGSNRAEWEANWFAGGFLMPAKAFRDAHKKGKQPSDLAQIFAVSEAAVEVRIKSLGL